jgi:hypothetical protein
MSGNDEDQNIINGEISKLTRHHYKKRVLITAKPKKIKNLIELN